MRAFEEKLVFYYGKVDRKESTEELQTVSYVMSGCHIFPLTSGPNVIILLVYEVCL